MVGVDVAAGGKRAAAAPIGPISVCRRRRQLGGRGQRDGINTVRGGDDGKCAVSLCWGNIYSSLRDQYEPCEKEQDYKL